MARVVVGRPSAFGRFQQVVNYLFNWKQSQLTGLVSTLFTGQGSFFSKDMSYKEAVETAYKQIVWVYRCAKELGEAVGSVSWKVFQRTLGSEELIALPGHPLESLLARPNPYKDGSEFFEAWAIFLQLAGNSFWEVVAVGGVPKHLYPIRPDWLKPIPDKLLFISGYKFDPGHGAKPVTLPPEDVIHFKFLDPLNEYSGMSPLTAAARTVQTENAAISWNKALFDNSAVPGGILKVPATLLERGEKELIEEDLAQQFTKDQMHKPLVLWGGMEWERMALSQKDMDFLKQRELNKFEICAVMGVPPQLVGAQPDPTYSNYIVARTSFWEDTIIPLLDWLKRKINYSLAPRFGDDIIADYDLSKIPAMLDSFKGRVETAKSLVSMGWPINAVNKRLSMGFDRVPWGDVWWAPMTLIPISSVEGIGTPAPGGPGGITVPIAPTEKPPDEGTPIVRPQQDTGKGKQETEEDEAQGEE